MPCASGPAGFAFVSVAGSRPATAIAQTAPVPFMKFLRFCIMGRSPSSGTIRPAPEYGVFRFSIGRRTRLLLCHPLMDSSRQNIQRQGTRAQHLIMKIAQIKFVA